MASTDFWLKIDGVEAETTDEKMSGNLQITSWSWGETNAGSFVKASGGGSGKVSMQDFHFTVERSKASPTLFMYCATGKHISNATFYIRRAGGGETPDIHETWTFTDCLISSYQTGGSPGELLPIDQVSFNFAKIEVDTMKQSNAGGDMEAGAKHGYDLQKNTKV